MDLLNTSSIYSMTQVKRPNYIAFRKKCESIRKAYRLDDENYDAVDWIMDELRQAKYKLVSFVKEATASEQFKETGKELFEIIVKVIVK